MYGASIQEIDEQDRPRVGHEGEAEGWQRCQ